MITFFHVADLHFGVENYGRVDSKTGIHSRLLDFKNSFDQCVDQAIKDDIDFFLFCGDAYKTAYPSPTQQQLLMSSFFKLQQAGIPIVLVIGKAHLRPGCQEFSLGHSGGLHAGNRHSGGFQVGHHLSWIEKIKTILITCKNHP